MAPFSCRSCEGGWRTRGCQGVQVCAASRLRNSQKACPSDTLQRVSGRWEDAIFLNEIGMICFVEVGHDPARKRV